MRSRILVFMLAWLAGLNAAAQDEMTGVFRMSKTVGDILGDQVAQAINETIPADQQLQWQVYVPYGYDASRPPGVLVYLDHNRYGGIPDPLIPVMNQHNLIWVGPRADRRQNAEQAVWHAILGLRGIEGDYAVDLNRLYVASSEDTAATAFRMYLFANEVRGAIYHRGSVMWMSLADDQIEQLRRKRHVFITGTNDEAKMQVRDHYEAFQKAGITDVKLIFDTQRIEPVPDAEHFDEAIRFLDGR